jgi:hypothetical protein
MSDERLREAERKWRETGAVEDEARYLLERVRVGDLTQERLEYCGHPAAISCSGAPRTKHAESFREWFTAIERFGSDAAIRAALTLGRSFMLPIWNAGPWGQDETPELLLGALEARVDGLAGPENLHGLVNAMQTAVAVARRGTGYAGLTGDIGVLWSAEVLARLPALLDRTMGLADVTAPFTGLESDRDHLRQLVIAGLLPWCLARRTPRD